MVGGGADDPLSAPVAESGFDAQQDKIAILGSVLQRGYPVDHEFRRDLVDLMLVLAHYPDAAPPPMALPAAPDSLRRKVWRALFK